MLRHLDLFSGLGGFSLGLEATGGFETVAFCDIEKFSRKVLKKQYKLMCDVDLSCEPFVKGRYKDIYVADTIYRFSNSDIIKIFNMALCYNVDMIPEPQQPKNPYTSIKFNINERTMLYNQISHVNSDVIMRFRMSKLNILSYTVENMQFVRHFDLKNIDFYVFSIQDCNDLG